MAGKREAKRLDLTNRLLEAATQRIIDHGLSDMRARNVARDAGCALGTIYKCFVDFDDLIMHVNSKTLKALGTALDEALANLSDDDNPLEALALTYAHFAMENTNLWAALFEHRLPQNTPIPQWHIEDHEALFHTLSALVLKAGSALDEENASIRARTYFAAIHGVVSISLQGRFVGVPQEKLDQELRDLVHLF